MHGVFFALVLWNKNVQMWLIGKCYSAAINRPREFYFFFNKTLSWMNDVCRFLLPELLLSEDSSASHSLSCHSPPGGSHPTASTKGEKAQPQQGSRFQACTFKTGSKEKLGLPHSSKTHKKLVRKADLSFSKNLVYKWSKIHRMAPQNWLTI